MTGKTILAIVLVFSLVGLVFYTTMTPDHEDFKDGAPTMTAEFVLVDLSGEELLNAEINVGEAATVEKATMKPATISATISGVQPGTPYGIEVHVDATATPVNSTWTGYLDGEASISGVSSSGDIFYRYYNANPYTPISQTDNAVEYPPGEFNFDFLKGSANGDKYFSRIGPSSSDLDFIYDTDLDGAIFTLEVTTVGTTDPSIWGSTTIDILLTVETNGTVNLEITGIEFTTTGPT